MNKPEACSVKDWTLCIMGLIICMGFFGIDAFILWLQGHKLLDLSDPNTTIIVNQIMTYKNGLTLAAAAYFYGASKSSTDKDKTIATLSNNASGPTTNVTGDKPIVNATATPDPLQPNPKQVG